jgi:hypothetical protein
MNVLNGLAELVDILAFQGNAMSVLFLCLRNITLRYVRSYPSSKQFDPFPFEVTI